jgi:hypothetical protein
MLALVLCLILIFAGGSGGYFPVGYGAAGMGAGYGGGGSYGYGVRGGGDAQWLTQYVKRLWAWEQMDFESCFDQMVTLMGPAPSTVNKVYKLAKYRKKTKNQWARDDPAFALVQVENKKTHTHDAPLDPRLHWRG